MWFVKVFYNKTLRWYIAIFGAMSKRTALLLGATGLTGEQCLQELLASEVYDTVVTVTRKPLVVNHHKYQNVVVDFEQLHDFKLHLKADDVYCTIGTTIAKAGSQKEFRRIDFDIPKQIAEYALWNGAQRFILCSALGANAQSSIFYNQVKGELEDVLKKMNYKTLLIFRPSILLGDRKETRTGEQIGRVFAEIFSFLFIGPLKQYKGTPVDVLAKQMVAAGSSNVTGTIIYENAEIVS